MKLGFKDVLNDIEKVCENCKFSGAPNGNGVCEMFDAVWDIEELEPKALEWVSVKDRLPDKETMLCLVKSDGDLHVSHWHWGGGGPWFYTDGEYDCNVTHWTKAPELPEGEDHDRLSR